MDDNTPVALIEGLGPGGTAEVIGQLRTSFPEGHALAGVGAKLERARAHLEDLNAEMVAFLNRKPYWFEFERGGRRAEFVLRAYAQETPPIGWSTMVGDFLQNVRTALDYLVWELAKAEIRRKRSAKTTPYGNTSFPIYLKRKAFIGDGLKKIQDLAPHPQAIIAEMQPYNRRYVSRSGVINMAAAEDLNRWYRGHELWKLHELARRDRHQALRVVGAATWSASGSDSTQLHGVRDASLEFGRFEVGSTVARWVLDREVAAFVEPGNRPLPLEPYVSLTLDQEDVYLGQLTLGLARILDYVDSDVVPRLKRFV